MILCGGPDWPTSVLAGILRLSLFQCLLGTAPIIFSIAPMALTGSFYLKRDESEVWTRTGNLMLLITTVVSAVFLVGIGWAIQDEYDRRGDLLKPKAEFVDLEWLDHRAACLAKQCKVAWHEVPRAVQVAYAIGAVVASFVGHLLLWFSNRCLGTFMLTDDIDQLKWIGAEGVLKPLGLAAVEIGLLSFAGLFVFHGWQACRGRRSRKDAQQALDATMEAWKSSWLQDQTKISTDAVVASGQAAVPTAPPTLLSVCSSSGNASIAAQIGCEIKEEQESVISV